MPEKSQKTFADVKGCPEAKAEVEEVHCYLTTLSGSIQQCRITLASVPSSQAATWYLIMQCLCVCTAAALSLNRAIASPQL